MIVLIAACVMWRIGGVETESALGDHQKYVYAYVSSIEGNEVTYMEVDESVAKAAEERAKEKAKAEDGAGSDSTGQGDKSDGGTDSAGQSDKNDGGIDSAGQSDKSGGTGSDEDKSGMGTPPAQVQMKINPVWEHHRIWMDHPVEIRRLRIWTAPRCRRAHRAACPI